jgi:hypothetical protein
MFSTGVAALFSPHAIVSSRFLAAVRSSCGAFPFRWANSSRRTSPPTLVCTTHHLRASIARVIDGFRLRERENDRRYVIFVSISCTNRIEVLDLGLLMVRGLNSRLHRDFFLFSFSFSRSRSPFSLSHTLLVVLTFSVFLFFWK